MPFNLELLCCMGCYVSLASIVALVLLIAYVYMTATEPSLGCHEKEKYYFDPSINQKTAFPSLKDPPTLLLTVVVPAYNEEERLSSMMDETMSYLENRQNENKSFTYEVIVVDDGSTDSTTKEALKYTSRYGAEKVRVLTLVKNKAKGGAVRMGMLRGRGQRLIFADADGATKFSDIEKLEKCLQDFTHDKRAVVCGSRAHLEKDSIAQRSIFRTILMYGFHIIVYVLGVRGIRDTQCGFKMFTRSAAQILFYNQHIEKWAFDVELLHIAQKLSIPIFEVPVTWTEIPGSKLSPFWASLQMFRDLFFIKLRYLLGFWKIKTKID